MSWLRIDDGFGRHHKVDAVSDKAFRLHVCAMCETSSQLLDGRIPRALLARLPHGKNPRVIQELVSAGLWDVDGDAFAVHGYLEWNPSGEAVRAKRDAARERMLRHRSPSVRANTERTNADCSVTSRDRDPVPSRPLRDPDPEITTQVEADPSRGVASVGTLALLPVGGTQTEPRKKPAARSVSTAPHPVLVAHYSAEFERLRGVKPPFDGRDGKAAAKILAALGGDVELAKQVVSSALAAPYGNPQTIRTIANDPAKWLTRKTEQPRLGAAGAQSQQLSEPKTIDQVLAEQAEREKRTAVRGVS